MKTRRNKHKNHKTYNNSAYTPGNNMFGQKAETYLIVLERETAFEQMMECICQLDGSTKEFTFDMRCFSGHEDELNRLMAKVQVFMEIKARISRKPLYDHFGWLNGAA